MITTSAPFNTIDAVLAKHPIILVKITGYSRVFTNYDTGVGGQYKWIQDMQDQGKTVTDLSGIADQRQIDMVVLDEGGAITGDFPGFLFEGKQVLIQAGYPGMLQSDFATIFTGVVSGVDSAVSNTCYAFTFLDNSAVLTQTIYNTGDNGLPTSTDNPRTINAHPLDVLIDILTNQITSQAGQFWDPSLVDLVKITAYRDGPLAGAQFKFTLTSPVLAKDFIASQIMVPLGGYLFTTAAGKFTVNFFYPVAAPTPVFTLDETVMVGVPSAGQADLLNSLEFRFDGDGNNYNSDITEQYGPSVAQYGLVGSTAIQSDGMRSGLQGFLMAAFVSRMVFLRYAFKNLSFGKGSGGTAILAFWPAFRLENGDLVAVTSTKIPDRQAGVMGVTAKLFEVLEVTYDLNTYKVNLVLIDAGYLTKIGFTQIAPDSEASYVAASAPDKARYMFLCDPATGEYSNGNPGNILG